MRSAGIGVVLILAAAISAYPAAAVVDATRSSHDPILVGNSSGEPIGSGYHVVLRDVGNIPLAGEYVILRFAASPVRPYQQQESGPYGTFVDCTALTLTRITNGQGEAVFHLRIAGFENDGTVEVRGNGVLLGHVLVRSTDLDGDGATDLRDLNAFRQRFESDRTAPETDFNQDGVTNGYDFDIFRAEFMRGAKGTVCP
jgi:hypothetical protein